MEQQAIEAILELSRTGRQGPDREFKVMALTYLAHYFQNSDPMFF